VHGTENESIEMERIHKSIYIYTNVHFHNTEANNDEEFSADETHQKCI
jgi:hypothetical protein